MYTSTKNHFAVANLEDTAPETTSNAFAGSQLSADFARPQPTSQSPVEQTAQGSATATADLLLKTFGIEQQILQPGCTLHLSMTDAYGQMFPLSELKVVSAPMGSAAPDSQASMAADPPTQDPGTSSPQDQPFLQSQQVAALPSENILVTGSSLALSPNPQESPSAEAPNGVISMQSPTTVQYSTLYNTEQVKY